MLIDTNIIIYAMKPEHEFVRQFIAEHSPAVSAVSYVEALGYHKLVQSERELLEKFFSAAKILPLTRPVLKKAVRLRQLRKMSLGDALIAGTALVKHLVLITRNTEDFKWIEGLSVLNPFRE